MTASSNLSFLDRFCIRTPDSTYNNTEISNAKLFLVNPDLVGLKGSGIQKASITLQKYLLRNNFRSTPFGLFAGVGVGKFSDNTNVVKRAGASEIFIDLDFEYLLAWCKSYEATAFLFPYVPLFSNNSIHVRLDFIRYFEFDPGRSHEKYIFSKVERNYILSKIIKFCAPGKTPLQIANLFSGSDFSSEEITSYLQDLVSHKVLISGLYPTVIGERPIVSIRKQLEEAHKVALRKSEDDAVKIQELLEWLSNIEREITKNKSTSEILLHEQLSGLNSEVSKLPVAQQCKSILKVDTLNKFNTCVVDKRVGELIVEAIGMLSRLFKAEINPPLAKFKERFVERWELQKIPLLEALDTDLGITYPPSQEFAANDKKNKLEIAAFYPTTEFWITRIVNALHRQKEVINIDESDFSGLADNTSLLPVTFTALFSIISSDPLIYLKSVGGASGANMISRFGSFPEMRELLEEIVRYEESRNPDTILAEVNYVTRGHTTNVLLRPTLRKYEIECLCTGSKTAHRIQLSDLYLCVRRSKLCLVSQSLDREVRPILSSAFNYYNSSFPVFRFLCDFQAGEESTFPKLNLELIENLFSYIPRITYKKHIILSPAKWRVVKTQMNHILSEKDPTIMVQKWEKFRMNFSIPQVFSINEHDQELVLDTSNPLNLTIFLKELSKKDFIVLRESLFNANSALVRDNSGGVYNHEIAMTIKNNSVSEYAENRNKFSPKESSTIQRSFLPGNEWIYLKLYTGANATEEILSSLFKVSKNLDVEKWHFVRYSDSNYHIRVRFLIDKKNYGKSVKSINKALKPYIRDRVIWKVQHETYEREIERYTEKFMTVTESIFHHDSVLHVGLFELVSLKQNTLMQMLVIIDSYLDVFGYTLSQKSLFVTGCLDSIEKNEKLNYDRNFRRMGSQIESLFDDTEDKGFCPNINTFKAELRSLFAAEIDMSELRKLLPDYLHMSINRKFEFTGIKRDKEVYYYLMKHYRRQLSRSFGKVKTSPSPIH